MGIVNLFLIKTLQKRTYYLNKLIKSFKEDDKVKCLYCPFENKQLSNDLSKL